MLKPEGSLTDGYELSWAQRHLSLMESKINLSKLTGLINNSLRAFFIRLFMNINAIDASDHNFPNPTGQKAIRVRVLSTQFLS